MQKMRDQHDPNQQTSTQGEGRGEHLFKSWQEHPKPFALLSRSQTLDGALLSRGLGKSHGGIGQEPIDLNVPITINA